MGAIVVGHQWYWTYDVIVDIDSREYHSNYISFSEDSHQVLFSEEEDGGLLNKDILPEFCCDILDKIVKEPIIKSKNWALALLVVNYIEAEAFFDEIFKKDFDRSMVCETELTVVASLASEEAEAEKKLVDIKGEVREFVKPFRGISK